MIQLSTSIIRIVEDSTLSGVQSAISDKKIYKKTSGSSMY